MTIPYEELLEAVKRVEDDAQAAGRGEHVEMTPAVRVAGILYSVLFSGLLQASRRGIMPTQPQQFPTEVMALVGMLGDYTPLQCQMLLDEACLTFRRHAEGRSDDV